MHHSIEFHLFHLHTFLMKSLMEDFSDTVDTWQLLLNYFHLSAQTYVCAGKYKISALCSSRAAGF